MNSLDHHSAAYRQESDATTRALLIAAAIWLIAPVTTEYPDQIEVFNVTDAKYGAVADAVVASGGANCNALINGPLNEDVGGFETCTTPGSGTDNTAAFQAAFDAACAAGGGIVYAPDGDYRIVDPDGALPGGIDPSDNCANVRFTGGARLYFGAWRGAGSPVIRSPGTR